jgi:hypothetical protein
MWNVTTCDIMGNWNYLTIIQKIAEQHNWKARHRLTRKHLFLGTLHIHQNILIKMYKMFVVGSSITCTINCNRRIAATLFTKKKLFVSGIKL